MDGPGVGEGFLQPHPLHSHQQASPSIALTSAVSGLPNSYRNRFKRGQGREREAPKTMNRCNRCAQLNCTVLYKSDWELAWWNDNSPNPGRCPACFVLV